MAKSKQKTDANRRSPRADEAKRPQHRGSPDPSKKEEEKKQESKRGRGSSRCRIIESYWVHNPLAKVNIVSMEGKIQYVAEEAELDPKEEEAYEKLKSLITKELSPPETLDLDLDEYILSEAKRLAKKYRVA
jgi:hypothetical protein